MSSAAYKGKHAELCKTIASSNKDEALQIIYGFFRSEENTDSYSISLLTMMREMLEDHDSDTLYQLRVRMRSQGDRVLINLAQFVTAFAEGGYEDEAETVAGKCVSELPKLARSMQEFADEEGLSPISEMAGLRVREAMRMLTAYFRNIGDKKSYGKCVDHNLEMTRIFLFGHEEFVAEDMMSALEYAVSRKNDERIRLLAQEIVESYDGRRAEILAAGDEVSADLLLFKKALEEADKALAAI